MVEREGELEEAHKEKEAWIPKGVPLYFNPESMVFELGAGEATRRYPPQESSYWGLLASAFEDEIPETDDPNSSEFLLLTAMGLLQLGSFRVRLAEIFPDNARRDQINGNVVNIMARVYELLDPNNTELKPPKNLKKTIGLWGFSSEFNNFGKFHLITFGNCSCLGINPQESFLPETKGKRQEVDTEHPYLYVPHNWDTQPQEVSILAGAGALAWFAKNR